MLDPDMRADELRLHMGEMTAQEVRTARAAIRWANSVRPSDDALVAATIERCAQVAEKFSPDFVPIHWQRQIAVAIRALSGKGHSNG